MNTIKQTVSGFICFRVYRLLIVLEFEHPTEGIAVFLFFTEIFRNSTEICQIPPKLKKTKLKKPKF